MYKYITAFLLIFTINNSYASENISIKERAFYQFNSGSYVEIKLLTGAEFYVEDYKSEPQLLLGELKELNVDLKNCNVLLKAKPDSSIHNKVNIVGSILACKSYEDEIYETELNGYIVDKNKNFGAELVLIKKTALNGTKIGYVDKESKYFFVFTKNIKIDKKNKDISKKVFENLIRN